MRILYLTLLNELSNVPEIRSKIYIITFLQGYISNVPEEILNDISIKIGRLSSSNVNKELFRIFSEGTLYTAKTFLEIFNQLDDSNKKIVWDYHDELKQILNRTKKEQ